MEAQREMRQECWTLGKMSNLMGNPRFCRDQPLFHTQGAEGLGIPGALHKAFCHGIEQSLPSLVMIKVIWLSILQPSSLHVKGYVIGQISGSGLRSGHLKNESASTIREWVLLLAQ